MTEPKLYVPGESRKADDLARLYDRMNSSAVSQRVDAQERDPKDPFGLNDVRELRDDLDAGKQAAERFTKFFALLVQDFSLAPRAAIFAAELTCLNIFNADDVPLSTEELDAARKAAYDYYVASRAKIPSSPTR